MPEIATGYAAAASSLVAHATALLDRDVDEARACLQRLAHLLAAEVAPGPGAVRSGLAPWQVKRVSHNVDANLGRAVPVADLAAVARLSSGHFCRAFKATFGTTPHRYVVSRRMDRARHLMLTTSEPLSEIAAACGLTDQAHLTRLFKKLFEQTPLAFRRQFREAA